jgi:hypothetical protein
MLELCEGFDLLITVEPRKSYSIRVCLVIAYFFP